MSATTQVPDVIELDGNRFRLGEGGRWDGTDFWQVNLLDGELWRSPGGTGPLERVLALDVPLGAVAPTRSGGRIVIAGPGVASVRPDGTVDWYGKPVAEDSPPRRVNDAAVSGGRMYFGTMDFPGTVGNGALWRFDPDRSITRLLSGLGTPNGPACTADGRTLYLADSSVGTVTRYPVSGDGSLGPGTPFAQIDPADGVPDGMTVDDADHLWVALWGGSAIVRFDPAGTKVATYRLPARQPTSVTIAGDRMLVTSAWEGLADRNAWDGATMILPSPVGAPITAAFG